MAVCTYASPNHPALAAYDYHDGSVRWTSQIEDLQGTARRRWIAALLLATLHFGGGSVRRCVFAANPGEFVAYDAEGHLIWKQHTADISSVTDTGIGRPISLNYTDSKELVTATTAGWVIKLNPLDGSTIDAYRMETTAVVGERIYLGTLTSFKSIVVVGNVLYLAAQFKADASTPLHHTLSPVYLARIDLCQSGIAPGATRIKPLDRLKLPGDSIPDRVPIGVNKSGGSPSAWVTPEGTVLIFANAEAWINGRLWPVIVAVEDDDGVLNVRWRSVLRTMPGDAIHAAPAIHEESRTLLVTTGNNIFVFRNADHLAGNVLSPPPLSSADLLPSRPGAATVRVGSPFALAFDRDADEIVAYTNFQIAPALGRQTYARLGAFALPVGRPTAPRPLWSRPLAVTATGAPAPGVGTLGQPALFRYDKGSGQETGLIVNTAFSGTYIIK